MAGQVRSLRVGGVELQVETVAVAGSQPTSTLDRARDAVEDAYVQAQVAIEAVAVSTVDLINRMAKRAAQPDQVEVKFGLKFTAQGGVLVAGVAGEAALEVKLVYGSACVPDSN